MKIKKYRGFTPSFPSGLPNLFPPGVTLSHSWVDSFALKTDGKTLYHSSSTRCRSNKIMELDPMRSLERTGERLSKTFGATLQSGFDGDLDYVVGIVIRFSVGIDVPSVLFWINWFYFVNIFYKLKKNKGCF